MTLKVQLCHFNKYIQPTITAGPMYRISVERVCLLVFRVYKIITCMYDFKYYLRITLNKIFNLQSCSYKIS